MWGLFYSETSAFNVIVLHYILDKSRRPRNTHNFGNPANTCNTQLAITMSIKSTSLDRLSIALSGICIVHCLLTPIALTILPILTLSSFVEDILFHQLMLWLVLPSSSIALFIGCRKHRNFGIAASGILGMLVLVLVAFLGHQILSPTLEKILTSVGGLILAYSHFLNYRACQTHPCEDDNCPTVHHH
jgi:hypothetical protein